MNTTDLEFLSKEDKVSLQKFCSDSHKVFLQRIKMSEEQYDELCKPYLSECHRYVDIIKTQKSRKSDLHTQLSNSNIAREEKSVGGETIHRGFYCPSLIRDIVLGNCKRGRLCKPDNSQAAYTYYFDNNNKLIATEQNENTEYISYYGNKSFGLGFCGDHLETISECEYDNGGRIKRYIFILCDSFCDKVSQYDKEVYTYTKDEVIVEFSFFSVNDPPILSLNKYIFTIENGYLKRYTIEVFDTEELCDTPSEGKIYTVKLKRKI